MARDGRLPFSQTTGPRQPAHRHTDPALDSDRVLCMLILLVNVGNAAIFATLASVHRADLPGLPSP